MAKKPKFTSGADKWTGTGADETVNGKGGDDKLNGKGGDDTINGGSGDDKITGGAGNDTLNGGSGDDTINAASGNDTVDGGTGDDIVILSGNFADATITKTGDVYTIVTAAGTVTVTNVETVRFADGDVDADDLIPPTGINVDLTAGTDTFTSFTTAADTITGAAGTLNAADIIIDNTAGDADVMNLTLTAINGAAKVSGIETINVNWDSFASAAFDATNVTGANIALSSTKLGFLGAATITATGANTVTTGTGMTGALTANGVTGATLNATNSSTVTAAGTAAATDTVTINAGASTTTVTSGTIETVTIAAGAATTAVTVTGYNTATITGGAATTAFTLTDDATTDSASVTVAADATVTNAGSTGKLALAIADGKTVTLDNIGADLTVTGTGSVTVKSAAFTGETITDSTAGSLTLYSTAAGANDFSKADADLFVLSAAGATTGTFVSGDKVQVVVDFAAAGALNVGGTGTSDSLTATFTKSQTGAITSTGVETLNVVAAATAVAGTDLSLLSLALTPTSGTGTVNLSGTNDVSIGTLTAGALDATGLTGDLTIGAVVGTDISVVGSTGVTTATLTGATTSAAFVGQNGNDVITFGALGAAETATAVTAGGNDTITVDVATTPLVGGSVSFETGAGNDTVNLTSAVGTTGTIVLQGGDGTDTLAVGASDVSKANLTITGFEAITVTGAATFAAATLDGKTYAVTGIAGAGDEILVSGTAAANTINLSLLVATDSASTGVSFWTSGGDGADTITGSQTNDRISGGKGADIISLTETSPVSDVVVFGNETTVTGGADIAFGALGGADTISGFTAGASGDVLTVDISAFGLAGGTEYVGALAGLAAASTDEFVILTGAGYATDEAAETAIAGQVTTDGLDMVFVYFNTTDNTAHIVHDTDAGVDGTGTTTLVGSITNLSTQALFDALTAANIDTFA